MKKLLVFFHTVSMTGFSSAIIINLVIFFPDSDLAGTFSSKANRDMLHILNSWILLPSMLVILLSGLFSIANHTPFHNSGWAWLKAALGILLFEGTLLGVIGPVENLIEIINIGDKENYESGIKLAKQIWSTSWLILGLIVINIWLAIWRPRFA